MAEARFRLFTYFYLLEILYSTPIVRKVQVCKRFSHMYIVIRGEINLAKKKFEVTHLHIGILATASIMLSIALLAQVASSSSAKNSDNGFNQYGYNYTARTFNGPADGVDKNLDGTVWGDPTYANDHLKMTWSKAWDDARFNGAPWGPDAWEDNQWNGSLKGGSGENWHYKIVWVGPELQNSPYWRDGGEAVWGQFEIITSQGKVDHQHMVEIKANPAGYGVFK